MPGFELKARARKLMLENAPKLFFVVIVYVAVITLMTELQYRLPGVSGALGRFSERLRTGETPDISLFLSGFKPNGAALALMLGLMIPVLEVGFFGYCIKIVRGGEGTYINLLDGFIFFGKIIILSIVTGVLIVLWSLLFIVPGMVAAYKYSQAYYILIDNPKKGVLRCIRESKRMMRGNKLDLFLLDLTFIGWFLLDIIISRLIPFPLPIIPIWLTPYFTLTRAGFYNNLILNQYYNKT